MSCTDKRFFGQSIKYLPIVPVAAAICLEADGVQVITLQKPGHRHRPAVAPSGYFEISNVAGSKVLSVESQSTADGARIMQGDDNGTLDHKWAVAPSPAGGFTTRIYPCSPAEPAFFTAAPTAANARTAEQSRAP
jgi:hypothetical protein